MRRDLNMHLTANLLRNLPVNKEILNRLRFDGSIVMRLWPRFWPTLYAVDRSSRLPFSARTDRQTDRQTKAAGNPTNASEYRRLE